MKHCHEQTIYFLKAVTRGRMRQDTLCGARGKWSAPPSVDPITEGTGGEAGGETSGELGGWRDDAAFLAEVWNKGTYAINRQPAMVYVAYHIYCVHVWAGAGQPDELASSGDSERALASSSGGVACGTCGAADAELEV